MRPLRSSLCTASRRTATHQISLCLPHTCTNTHLYPFFPSLIPVFIVLPSSPHPHSQQLTHRERLSHVCPFTRLRLFSLLLFLLFITNSWVSRDAERLNFLFSGSVTLLSSWIHEVSCRRGSESSVRCDLPTREASELLFVGHLTACRYLVYTLLDGSLEIMQVYFFLPERDMSGY